MDQSLAKAALLVAAGGAMGSVMRFLISVWIKTTGGFPWPTLLVNILGCLIIGVIYGISGKYASEQMRLLLATGFCGGFTTFSAFGQENLELLQHQQYLLATLYTLCSLIGGIGAAWLGNSLAGKW